jgi:tryptophan-rich sensory protein
MADGATMNNTLKLVISVAVPLVVGGLSGYATARGVADWYPTLTKPSFNPPAWVFGPAWTLLYIMMGVAAFLVWRKGLDVDGVRIALTVFAVQLALNGLWSILFFGMRAPGLALAEIILLWIAIAITTVLFWRVTPTAGVLLLPYLGWVSFATVLNASLWWLNRSPVG